MNRSEIFRARALWLLWAVMLAWGGCRSGDSGQPASSPGPQAAGEEKIRIGLSMDSLRVERWKRDRDLFVAKAGELGAEVLVQNADADPIKQIAQCENLLAQGVDVLVVIPRDGVAAAQIVEAAHRQGVPVLAYDRLIRNCDLDLYISFDNERVGYLQAEYLTRVVPKGRYFLLGGSPSDNNAHLLRRGQMRALEPFIERGEIEIVGDQWCENWDPNIALKHVENALTANQNRIDAIVASNDGTAGGAIAALQAAGLAGKVAVSGQDADLAACQRIAEGTQTMTVYKPLRPLAERAAELAVALARGEPIQTDTTLNNGKKDVPSVLLDPIPVDRNNLYEVVIQDGFHPLEAVYQNVPRDQWPTAAAD
ncbi:MAG: D-xylose ABC transporter substrate-binding protein [Candidatus Poribacteria bacterium]|nr:MAG: D-xylose ABC transporter substrate-binding protein [Candidatus Poribacteria bacterium]